MATNAIDFEKEGLLAGVNGPQAVDARKRLIRYLLEDLEVPLDEIKLATQENRLLLLPLERTLGGDPQYTAHEVAELAEVDVKLLLELRRALGLAEPPLDQRVFSDFDVGVMRSVKLNMELGIALDDIREINRVLGSAMSQLAAAVQRVFLSSFVRPDDDEHSLAVRLGEVSQISSAEFGYVLQHVFNLHLREQSRVIALGTDEAIDLLQGTSNMAVCFADLIGFTSLGEQIPADELGAIAERLNEIAVALVEPPVRLVKTIGDAVMLASTEPDTLLDTALRLVEIVEQEGEQFPSVSVGMDMGEVIARGGDIYGPPVNHASRVCDAARAGTVLTTGALHDAFPHGYDWTHVGRRKFKGMEASTDLYRVREKGGREREKRRDKDRERQR